MLLLLLLLLLRVSRRSSSYSLCSLCRALMADEGRLHDEGRFLIAAQHQGSAGGVTRVRRLLLLTVAAASGVPSPWPAGSTRLPPPPRCSRGRGPSSNHDL